MMLEKLLQQMEETEFNCFPREIWVMTKSKICVRCFNREGTCSMADVILIGQGGATDASFAFSDQERQRLTEALRKRMVQNHEQKALIADLKSRLGIS